MGQRAGSPGIRRSKICLTRDIVRLGWRPQCPWAETASGEKAPDAATLPCLLYLG